MDRHLPKILDNRPVILSAAVVNQRFAAVNPTINMHSTPLQFSGCPTRGNKAPKKSSQNLSSFVLCLAWNISVSWQKYDPNGNVLLLQPKSSHYDATVTSGTRAVIHFMTSLETSLISNSTKSSSDCSCLQASASSVRRVIANTTGSSRSSALRTHQAWARQRNHVNVHVEWGLQPIQDPGRRYDYGLDTWSRGGGRTDRATLGVGRWGTIVGVTSKPASAWRIFILG